VRYTLARVRRVGQVLTLLFLLVASVSRSVAGQTAPARFRVYGFLQFQYDRLAADTDTPDVDASTDRVFFRRLVTGVEAPVAANWVAVLQMDFAPLAQGDRVEIRDAYVRYTGFSNRGLTITVGNQKTPFSRALLVSSSKRGLIERPFTGDRLFASPGRTIGVRIDGLNKHTLLWSGAVTSALQAPNVNLLRIDGLALSQNDWNDGYLFTGRVEWHPLGEMLRDQGDFEKGKLRVAIGAAAYRWQNDGDRNFHGANRRSTSATDVDLDDAAAVELSGGLRGRGWSADAEYHHVNGSTVDPAFSGGVYRDGEVTLNETSVEVGYMVKRERFEVVSGIDSLDVKARSATEWRPSVCAVYYFDRHNVKLSVTQRESFNTAGFDGVRTHATYVQMQVIF
jgi:phosphate-selective porin OprO and OprP